MARYRPSGWRLRLLALTALGPLLGACSEPGEAACERAGQAGFEARAPFDARARMRRVDCAFLSSVHGLARAPDGSLWLRRNEYKDRGDDTFYFPPDKLMTHVGAGGELLGELPLPDFVQKEVVHPSGELTLVGWERTGDAKTVQVRRLRPDGSLVTERVLDLPVPPEERLSYEASASGSVRRVELPEEERSLGILAARAHGEDLFLLVGMDGVRLLRLGGDLRVRWASVVEPSVALVGVTSEQMRALGLPLIGWGLDVDEAGRAVVANPFLVYHRRAYAQHFPPPEGPEGKALLVTRFAPTGERLAARTVAAEHVEEVVGLVASGESFTLGARAGTPVEQPDKRTEADVFFAAGWWDAPADTLVTRTHTLDQDDAPVALLPCGSGRYCFAGHTSFRDTNTGRTHEPGEGFILVVDARGEPQDVLRLQGERDTEVLHAVAGPEGSVVFALSTNQPANLARVGDAFKNNETWLGVFSPP